MPISTVRPSGAVQPVAVTTGADRPAEQIETDFASLLAVLVGPAAPVTAPGSETQEQEENQETRPQAPMPVVETAAMAQFGALMAMMAYMASNLPPAITPPETTSLEIAASEITPQAAAPTDATPVGSAPLSAQFLQDWPSGSSIQQPPDLPDLGLPDPAAQTNPENGPVAPGAGAAPGPVGVDQQAGMEPTAGSELNLTPDLNGMSATATLDTSAQVRAQVDGMKAEVAPESGPDADTPLPTTRPTPGDQTSSTSHRTPTGMQVAPADLSVGAAGRAGPGLRERLDREREGQGDGGSPAPPLGAPVEMARGPAGGPSEQVLPEPLRRLAAFGASPEQVMKAIAQTAREIPERPGAYSVTLRLHPEHLGALTVRLQLEGSQVLTFMEVAHPEALQALQKHVDSLRQGLNQSGLELAGFSVSTGQSGSGERERRHSLHEMPERAEFMRIPGTVVAGGPIPSRTAARSYAGGRLDRLA